MIALASAGVLPASGSSAAPPAEAEPRAWSGSTKLTGASPVYSFDTAVDGEVLHFVWTTANVLKYRRSTDGGVTWTPPLRLARWTTDSDAGRNGGTSTVITQVATAGGEVHVTWNLWTPTGGELRHRASSDGGATWGRARLVPGIGYDMPILAASDGAAHLFWGADCTTISYLRTRNCGESWAGPRVLFTGDCPQAPNAAVAGDAIHLVFQGRPAAKNGQMGIYYRTSPDAGKTWQPAKVLAAVPIGPHGNYTPAIAVAGLKVYTAWSHHWYASDQEVVYTRASVDGGTTWSTPQSRGDGSIPLLATAGRPAYLVFGQAAHDLQLWVSRDRGATWSSLPWPAAWADGEVQIGAAAGVLYVFWKAEAGTPGPPVYFRRRN